MTGTGPLTTTAAAHSTFDPYASRVEASPWRFLYGLNPLARNRMTMAMFHLLAEDAGLQVVESKTLDWGGIEKLDGLTLLRRR